MGKKLHQVDFVGWMIGVSSLILFISSIWRHELFNSGAWDLGIFDQAVYLISQGLPPISSFLNFHILADHAAGILYPLALLYKIYPSVYWLFAVQSGALALGALPTWYLARQAGLKAGQAVAMVAVYLLYPLVYNANLFDFHPDAIAVPAILTAVLAARLGRLGWFCASILLVLGCKAVLSLTVAAMGVWLLFFEKRRLYGAIALFSGISWYLIANNGIIPFFGSEAALLERHLYRYSYLGKSFSEMTQILLFQPGIILAKVFSSANFEYLLWLLIPVIWGLKPKYITPLIGAIPCIALNLLADHPSQKNLVFHYSLPAIPFLILAVIASLAAGRAWLQQKQAIILWSLVWFLALAKFGFFGSRHLKYLDTWQATKQAIALVQTPGSVLTTYNIAPHLTHRPLIKSTDASNPPADLNAFDYILLNTRHHFSTPEFANSLVNQLNQEPEFKLKYQRDDVYLFVKN
ncbi:putative membrane protein [Cylindrospermum stagnale PCC 7417]|uniref:Putative membrane protein n=1 Tax=Cylindrospermum stagnale PCC 7417 TaxID=56107 RepID=K9X370_9NOST|nr:DUF2079 domain-containing protein [Cylindrospermum stagnale]AFZ27065.1 putative membrane protein [Cylindrospermum stagnale PCC 7417]